VRFARSARWLRAVKVLRSCRFVAKLANKWRRYARPTRQTLLTSLMDCFAELEEANAWAGRVLDPAQKMRHDLGRSSSLVMKCVQESTSQSRAETAELFTSLGRDSGGDLDQRIRDALNMKSIDKMDKINNKLDKLGRQKPASGRPPEPKAAAMEEEVKCFHSEGPDSAAGGPRRAHPGSSPSGLSFAALVSAAQSSPASGAFGGGQEKATSDPSPQPSPPGTPPEFQTPAYAADDAADDAAAYAADDASGRAAEEAAADAKGGPHAAAGRGGDGGPSRPGEGDVARDGDSLEGRERVLEARCRDRERALEARCRDREMTLEARCRDRERALEARETALEARYMDRERALEARERDRERALEALEREVAERKGAEQVLREETAALRRQVAALESSFHAVAAAFQAQSSATPAASPSPRRDEKGHAGRRVSTAFPRVSRYTAFEASPGAAPLSSPAAGPLVAPPLVAGAIPGLASPGGSGGGGGGPALSSRGRSVLVNLVPTATSDQGDGGHVFEVKILKGLAGADSKDSTDLVVQKSDAQIAAFHWRLSAALMGASHRGASTGLPELPALSFKARAAGSRLCRNLGRHFAGLLEVSDFWTGSDSAGKGGGGWDPAALARAYQELEDFFSVEVS